VRHLITGGGGFSGSHLADALFAARCDGGRVPNVEAAAALKGWKPRLIAA
jgi:nucleoside-diphosphate-sugar epimerase